MYDRYDIWLFEGDVKLSLTDCPSWLYLVCSLWVPPYRRLRRSRSPFAVGSHSDQQSYFHRISSLVVVIAEVAEHPFDCAIFASSGRSPSWPPGSSETEPPVPSRYNTSNTKHALTIMTFSHGLFFPSVSCNVSEELQTFVEIHVRLNRNN